MTHTHLDSHHIPSIKHLPEVNGFQKNVPGQDLVTKKYIDSLVRVLRGAR